MLINILKNILRVAFGSAAPSLDGRNLKMYVTGLQKLFAFDLTSCRDSVMNVSHLLTSTIV